MDAMEWSVIEEFKDVFEGKILFSNTVLRMIKSSCNLTTTQKKKITIKNLVKKTLLGILRNQDGGFDILMDALAKEEKANGFHINKMKTRLQKKRGTHKRLKNTDHHNSSNVEEDGVYAELLTTVTGVPNNTNPEVESLKSITDKLKQLRNDMDPQNLKSHMSLEELHRETIKVREKVHRHMKKLKRESQEKDEEIQKLLDKNKELFAAQQHLENENSRLQNEKEKLRLKRNEELLNIDADVHQPIVQNIITAHNIIVN